MYICSIGMNNWICYGHLGYYVLIEFELYHCEVNFYLRKVRLDNRLILGLWNLIHSILKICKIESQIHESSNLSKQSFLESIWLFKTPYIIFLSIAQSICTHYSCFENMKKIRSKIWTWRTQVAKNRVIIIQKEKKQPGLFSFK